MPFQHIRLARPVTDLQRTTKMYCEGLGLAVVGSFVDHDGFDGVMVGLSGAACHFEFTRSRRHAIAPTPSAEDLVVFYIPDPLEWREKCARMVSAGFHAVTSFNPYWDARGRTFTDADGYRVVLQQEDWAALAF